MKKAILFVLTFVAFTLVSNDAMSPSPVQAQYIWTCRASSPVAVGMWSHPNQEFAARRAIQECQVRTPPHMFCYLDGCY